MALSDGKGHLPSTALSECQVFQWLPTGVEKLP